MCFPPVSEAFTTVRPSALIPAVPWPSTRTGAPPFCETYRSHTSLSQNRAPLSVARTGCPPAGQAIAATPDGVSSCDRTLGGFATGPPAEASTAATMATVPAHRRRCGLPESSASRPPTTVRSTDASGATGT